MTISHQSTTTSMPTTKGNAFPHFEDGDVSILLSASRSYQLHARTLRMHSPYFARLLLEDRAAKLSPKAKKEGVRIQYRIELALPAEDEEGVGRLHLRVSIRILYPLFELLLILIPSTDPRRTWPPSWRKHSRPRHRKRPPPISHLQTLRQSPSRLLFTRTSPRRLHAPQTPVRYRRPFRRRRRR